METTTLEALGEVPFDEAYLAALDREEAGYRARGDTDRVKMVQAERKRARGEKPATEPKGAPETTTQPRAPETTTPPAPNPDKPAAKKRAPRKRASK